MLAIQPDAHQRDSTVTLVTHVTQACHSGQVASDATNAAIDPARPARRGCPPTSQKARRPFARVVAGDDDRALVQ